MLIPGAAPGTTSSRKAAEAFEKNKKTLGRSRVHIYGCCLFNGAPGGNRTRTEC